MAMPFLEDSIACYFLPILWPLQSFCVIFYNVPWVLRDVLDGTDKAENQSLILMTSVSHECALSSQAKVDFLLKAEGITSL